MILWNYHEVGLWINWEFGPAKIPVQNTNLHGALENFFQALKRARKESQHLTVPNVPVDMGTLLKLARVSILPSMHMQKKRKSIHLECEHGMIVVLRATSSKNLDWGHLWDTSYEVMSYIICPTSLNQNHFLTSFTQEASSFEMTAPIFCSVFRVSLKHKHRVKLVQQMCRFTCKVQVDEFLQSSHASRNVS